MINKKVSRRAQLPREVDSYSPGKEQLNTQSQVDRPGSSNQEDLWYTQNIIYFFILIQFFSDLFSSTIIPCPCLMTLADLLTFLLILWGRSLNLFK